MTDDSGFELPEHIVAKIAKVLGVSAAQLEGYDLVKLIEELCDTALMFDQEEREAGQSQQPEPQPATAPIHPAVQ